MITIETDRTTGSAQTAATEVLGWIPGVSQGGRLGTELAFQDLDRDHLDALRKRLRAGGHRVWTTRS